MIIHSITNTIDVPYNQFCEMMDEMGQWTPFERGIFDGLNASVKNSYEANPQYELGYLRGMAIGEQYPDADYIAAFQEYCESISIDASSFDVRMFGLDVNKNITIASYYADGIAHQLEIDADTFQLYLAKIYAKRELEDSEVLKALLSC